MMWVRAPRPKAHGVRAPRAHRASTLPRDCNWGDCSIQNSLSDSQSARTHTGGGVSISSAQFKCTCSITDPPTCTREDPQFGTQTNVLAFYEFKAALPHTTAEDYEALTDANKRAAIAKIKELFNAYQEARSADVSAGRKRKSQSTELGAGWFWGRRRRRRRRTSTPFPGFGNNK